MKAFLLSACVLACTFSASAAELLVLPRPDVAAALTADGETKGRPYRFAVPIPVLVTPATHGAWSEAEGVQRWRLTVTASGAKSLNFAFTRFNLPAGAALTVASATDRRGPYTPSDAIAGEVWTPVVRGDTAVIELTLPAGARTAVDLALTRVNYGFRGFGAKDDDAAKSGACNVDVACAEGDAWRDEIRSVARYTVAGALLCTGQLVNNTAQDFAPYFLTASHCASDALAATTVFYWNYETSTCGARNPNGSLNQTQRGAVVVATSAAATAVGSDFTLLRLLLAPDPAFRVFYAGWDSRDVAPRGVTGIHHPNGDEKRISFDFDQTRIADYLDEPTDDATGTHLKVERWDLGVTEGGSSGSGIWNRDHRLVGTLSGGYSSCDAPDDPDWYGRFNRHWHANPAPLTSVAFWLDPAGTGNEVLDGADPNGISTSAPRAGSGLLAGGGLPALSLGLLLVAALLRRR